MCVCVCARMHVYVFCFLFTPTSQKRIDSRKWSMMGKHSFYFTYQITCFNNYTGLEVLTKDIKRLDAS